MERKHKEKIDNILYVLSFFFLFVALIHIVAANPIGYKFIQNDTVIRFYNNGSIENETYFKNSGAYEQFANKINRFDWTLHEFGFAVKVGGSWGFYGSSNLSRVDRLVYSDNSTYWLNQANTSRTISGVLVEYGVRNRQALNDDYMRRNHYLRVDKDINNSVWFIWKFKNINIDLDNDTDVIMTTSNNQSVNFPLDLNYSFSISNITSKRFSITDYNSENASGIEVFWLDDNNTKMFYFPNNNTNGNVILAKRIGKLKKDKVYKTSFYWIDIPICGRFISDPLCGIYAVIDYLEFRNNHTASGKTIVFDGNTSEATNVSWRIRTYDWINGRVCANVSFNTGCIIQWKQNDTNGSLPLTAWNYLEPKLIEPTYTWRTCNDTYYSKCRSVTNGVQGEDSDPTDDFRDDMLQCHEPKLHYLQHWVIGFFGLGSGVIWHNCTDTTEPYITLDAPENNTYLGEGLSTIEANCTVIDEGILVNASLWGYGFRLKTETVVNSSKAVLHYNFTNCCGNSAAWTCTGEDKSSQVGDYGNYYIFWLVEPLQAAVMPDFQERLIVLFLGLNDKKGFIPFF